MEQSKAAFESSSQKYLYSDLHEDVFLLKAEQ